MALSDTVTRTDPSVLRGWSATLDHDDLAFVEGKLADLTGEGWRVDPSRMAEHFRGEPLDQGWRAPPHVRYLAGKFRQLVLPHDDERASKRQIWNLPGRYGKSRLGSQWGPAWCLDRSEGHARIIGISYGDMLADENADAVRSILRAHPNDLRCQLRADRQRLDRFVTDQGGGILYSGINSTVTGFGAGDGGGLIIDDPFKNWQEAHSEARREHVFNQYRGTLRNRLDDDNAFILIIHHRVHEDDLTAKLIEEMERDDDYGDRWDVTVLPALADVGDVLGRAPGEPLDPERFPLAAVRNRMVSMGTYLACTPAETPILMADWTERPIGEVKVGDRVVGFTAEPGHNVRYQPSVVTAAEHRPGLVADFKMASRRVVRATRDHKWFVRSGRKYQVAQVGTPLRQVVEVRTAVTERERELWAWLAGMIDGEGHIRKSKVNIVQAIPRNAPVADRLRDVLTELRIPFNERHEPSKDELRSDRLSFDLHRAGWVLRMCLEHTPLAKREQAAAALYEGSGRIDRMKDRVLSIDGESVEDVYALRTETGNYVAWGYACSNSSLELQKPTPEEGNDIKRYWFTLASNVPVYFDDSLTSWDTALKDKETNDFTVGQLWARAGAAFWCLAELRGHFDQPTMRAAIALMSVRYPWNLRHVVEFAAAGPEVVEKLTAGSGVDYVLSDEIAAALSMADHERPAVEALLRGGLAGVQGQTVRGDKRVRARAVTPLIEPGNVHLPEHALFVPGFLDEVAAFPRGTHDDRVDAMSQALTRLWGTEATLVEPEVLVTARLPRSTTRFGDRS